MLEQQRTPTTFLSESNSLQQKVLDRLLAMTERMTTAEGRTQTLIPFLSIVRHSHQTRLIPVVLTPSFCLILQGTKQLHLGQDMLQYHASDYLASVIDIPASAQIIGATKQFPYIGLRVDFTTQEVASVVMEADIKVKPQENKLNTAAFIGRSDADFLDICTRLLKLLDKPQEARFLSALIKRDQKHLRLQEARRLLLSGSMDATTAALEVGYQSPSQFSREYRRLFGLPPLQDIKAVRNSAAAGAFEKR